MCNRTCGALYAPTSDAGLRNLAKRHVPASRVPATLTLQDFVKLQQDINQQFGDAAITKTKFEPTPEPGPIYPMRSARVTSHGARGRLAATHSEKSSRKQSENFSRRR